MHFIDDHKCKLHTKIYSGKLLKPDTNESIGAVYVIQAYTAAVYSAYRLVFFLRFGSLRHFTILCENSFVIIRIVSHLLAFLIVVLNIPLLSIVCFN